jgi:outer membrane immunogenic protein
MQAIAKYAAVVSAIANITVAGGANAQDAKWGGFHAGIHVGKGWADVTAVRIDATNTFPAGFTTDRTYNGMTGGGHLGYDWNFSNIVIGIEGDHTAGNLNSSLASASPLVAGRTSLTESQLKHISTLTGRLGYAHQDWLLYTRAGVAWTSVSTQGPVVNAASTVLNMNELDYSRTGWLVGAGTEWALAKNLALRAEYNYMNFGKGEVTNFSTSATSGVVTTSRLDTELSSHALKLGVTLRFN